MAGGWVTDRGLAATWEGSRSLFVGHSRCSQQSLPTQRGSNRGLAVSRVQDTYKDRWLELARRAFAELDAGNRGSLEAPDIAAAFGSHLSPYEVDAAVHQALLEATGSLTAAALDARDSDSGGGGTEAAAAAPPMAPALLDFDHFLGMLRSGSGASLELFDDRWRQDACCEDARLW